MPRKVFRGEKRGTTTRKNIAAALMYICMTLLQKSHILEISLYPKERIKPYQTYFGKKISGGKLPRKCQFGIKNKIEYRYLKVGE